MPLRLISMVDMIMPMHEQALLDYLSNYHKQLMSINIRISLATSNPGDTIDRSIPKRHKKKRRTGNGIDRGRFVPTHGFHVTKVPLARTSSRTTRPPGHQIEKPEGKEPMHDFGEITSTLCDVHMVLTHLVEVEMTDLRCQAEGLEDIAFQTVDKLADMALLAEKRLQLPRNSRNLRIFTHAYRQYSSGPALTWSCRSGGGDF